MTRSAKVTLGAPMSPVCVSRGTSAQSGDLTTGRNSGANDCLFVWTSPHELEMHVFQCLHL